MRSCWCACTLAAALYATSARAGNTGIVAGQIVDAADGAPLAGAVIVATGPALQGEVAARTGASGEFALAELAPGPCTLDVRREGYQPFTVEQVGVQLDRVVRLQLAMRRQGAAGAAVGSAPDRPALSAPTTETGGVVTAGQMALIPYGRDRQTFEEAAAPVPGVLATPAGPRLPGAQPGEARTLVDGLDVTPLLGPAATRLTQRFVGGISVLTGGYSAEFGRASGALLHAVTRAGSNDFHGAVFVDAMPLTAARQGPGPGADSAWQPGVELGGPLQRDRLWFHAGIAPESAAGGDVQYAGKLTFRADDGHSFVLSAFGDPGSGGGSNDAVLRYDGRLLEGAMLVQGLGGWHHERAGADRFQGALQAGNFVEAAGRHLVEYGVDAMSESVPGRTRPSLAAFAQDRWSIAGALFVNAGLRWQHDDLGSALLPRLGVSYDFTGRGLSRVYVSYGRYAGVAALGPGLAADAVSSGAQVQFQRDFVAGVDYTHRRDAASGGAGPSRIDDSLTAFVGKQLSQNYLLQASATVLPRRSDADPTTQIYKLDAAYAYEWDPRTTATLGTSVQLVKGAAWDAGVDARAALRYELTPSYQLTLSADVLNALNQQGDPGQAPLAARFGAALSF